VVAIGDTYAPAIRRAMEIAPGVTSADDVRRALDLAAVEAVIVATPTPAHAPVALAALEAGKHLYCEVPLASSVTEARAIAETPGSGQGARQGRTCGAIPESDRSPPTFSAAP
jgi:predicted dehydrogenase